MSFDSHGTLRTATFICFLTTNYNSTQMSRKEIMATLLPSKIINFLFKGMFELRTEIMKNMSNKRYLKMCNYSITHVVIVLFDILSL